MAFTEKDVDYISKLARIYLSDEEKRNFTTQLDSILEYVDKLNELDTSDIEPTAHILPLNNVMRDDTVKKIWDTELAIRQSPLMKDRLYIVAKVIE